MRMLLAFAGVVALLFTSCSDVEQFREPIESITAEWDEVTASVKDFVGSLETTQQDLQNQFAELSVPEGLRLNAASADQVAELKDGYQEELGSLSDLSGEVSNFITGWQEKAGLLTELKEGLAAGSLGGATMGTVEQIQEHIEEGRSQMESWRGELEDIRDNTADISEQFNTLMAKLQGS